MRARISATIAVLFLALLSPFQMPSAHAVVSDGVGVSTNGLQFFYDAANYAGVSGSTVKDLSGNSRDATLTQTNSKPAASTSNGGHFTFDGGGGYIAGPAYNSFPTFTGLTVSFYANFGTTAGSFERIIDFGNGASNNNLEVGRVSTGADFFIEAWNGGASAGWCRANGSVDSNWHFWVVTLNGSVCNIYKDNTQIVTNAAYNTLPTAGSWSNMYIGKSNWADAAFEGGIAELAFYNRVISTSEMTQNYNAAMDQSAPTLTGAVLTQSLSMPENSTEAGSLTGSEVGSQYKMLTASDSAKFSLVPYGGASTTISFISPPNYESTTSVSATNTYTASVLIYDSSGNWNTLTISISVTNVVEYSTVSAPSLSASPTKGTTVTITVTPSVAAGSGAGKVTFLIAGKRIPGCYKKSYTSGNLTCSWKPSISGLREIAVTYTPNNTEYALSTNKKSFQILRRTTTR